jgi:DNA-binding MarR family transcriptional regulator
MRVSEPQPESDVDAVIANLRELFDRARRFGVQMAQDVHPQLEPAEYSLLVDIAAVQPVRATDLAAERQVDKGLVSRQLRALQRLGLIERTDDPHDSRATLVTMSEAGELAVAEMAHQRQRFASRLFANLSAAQRRSVAASLELLNRTLRDF